jgi:putative membrane protein
MQKRLVALAATLVVGMAFTALSVAQDTASPNTNAAQARRDHRSNEATAAMSGYNGTKSTETNPDSSLTQQEKKFLLVAAQDGKDQVAIGKVVEENSHDKAVKRFAQRMVQDHGKINKELRFLAQKNNYEIPNQMNGEGIALQAKLEKLSGRELSKTYLKTIIEQRANALRDFKMASQAATHPAIKQFASKTLTVLKSQLQEAKWLASKEGVNVNQSFASAQQ